MTRREETNFSYLLVLCLHAPPFFLPAPDSDPPILLHGGGSLHLGGDMSLDSGKHDPLGRWRVAVERVLLANNFPQPRTWLHHYLTTTLPRSLRPKIVKHVSVERATLGPVSDTCALSKTAMNGNCRIEQRTG